MHLSSEAVTEDRDLLLRFDERFCAYRDCRIGLSSGKFQQEILRLRAAGGANVGARLAAERAEYDGR